MTKFVKFVDYFLSYFFYKEITAPSKSAVIL